MASSKKPARTYSYNRLAGTLHITARGKEQGYFLDRAVEGGWELTKLLDRGTVYAVRLAGGGSCNCKGFRSHRTCKHRDALAHMAATGRI